MVTDLDQYKNVNFKKLNKDLEIFINISQNDEAEKSLGNLMMQLGDTEPFSMNDETTW